MKKKLLLLAGILALGATTFTAEIPATPSPVTPEDAVEVITDLGDQNENLEKLTLELQSGEKSNFSGSYSNGIHWRGYNGPGRSDKEGATMEDSEGNIVANPGVGNYSNTGNRLQYNVASGKLNFGNLGFSYDVDRYDYFNKDWDKTLSLSELYFGLDYQMGTFDAFGKEWTFDPTIAYEYGKNDDYSSHASDPTKSPTETQRLITVTPRLRTSYLGFATTISPNVAYDDINGTVSFGLNASMTRKLNEYWSYGGFYYFDIRGTKNSKSGTDTYANTSYTGTINDNEKYAFSMEHYINFEKKIIDNFYFSTLIELDTYSILQQGASDRAYLYAIPKIQYKGKIGDWNVNPYVSTFMGTSIGYDSSSSRNQIRAGVTFGTSF